MPLDLVVRWDDPWRFVAFPAVWLLVAFLIGAYVYTMKVIGPRVVPPGQPIVTRRQGWCFAAAMAILWSASDWPIHEIGEQYLYSVHMLQHMMLTYFMPPLVLLATPEWAMRLILGHGRAYRVIKWFCHPVVAGVLFNVAVMVTHIPGVVEASARNPGAIHYGIHAMVVILALLMWMPLIGPIPEFQMSTGAKMPYLFAQSIIPTVPAGWLAFAEGSVYKHYGRQAIRVFDLSPTIDQQIAGAIMKTGGSIFLWAIIVWMWFKRFSANHRDEYDFRRSSADAERSEWVTTAPKALGEEPLTYADVERAFQASEPIAESATRPDGTAG